MVLIGDACIWLELLGPNQSICPSIPNSEKVERTFHYKELNFIAFWCIHHLESVTLTSMTANILFLKKKCKQSYSFDYNNIGILKVETSSNSNEFCPGFCNAGNNYPHSGVWAGQLSYRLLPYTYHVDSIMLIICIAILHCFQMTEALQLELQKLQQANDGLVRENTAQVWIVFRSFHLFCVTVGANPICKIKATLFLSRGNSDSFVC